MKFTELTVHTTNEGSEIIADILWRYTNYGVAISDVKDVIALREDKAMYWDYMDESLTEDRGDVLVKAFISLDETPAVLPRIREDAEEAVSNGRGYINFGTLEMTNKQIEGDDWLEIWRKHFRPLHIGGKIVVCPEWIEYEKKAGEEVVKLDNNMAFGTGEHETTSMCLKLLQEYIADGERSVLFSTHILSDLEQIADYIFFINDGKKILYDMKDEILENFLLVKGDLNEIDQNLTKELIGIEKNQFGFEAILPTDKATLLSKNFILEKPNIDQIVIHYIRDIQSKQK